MWVDMMRDISKMKPMLAYTVEDTSNLTYPILVSVKLDGIRCYIKDGVAYSRSGKPIRSKVVQEKFGKAEYNGLDGELLYGDWNAKNVFNLTTQCVMSTNLPEGFEPNLVTFAVFDRYDSTDGAIDRYESLYWIDADDSDAHLVTKYTVHSETELLEVEQESLNIGYEGVMVQSLTGTYKYGRSTAREGYIGKLKRFVDEEAVIVGFEELMHNENEQKRDAFGNAERSTAKDGLVPAGTLGALVVSSEKWGEFKIGTGYDAATRQQMWNDREQLIGKIVKYKLFAVGVIDKPRFPVFLGLRDEDDLS